MEEIIKCIQNNFELIIAFLALFVSLSQAYFARNHNKLAVTPFLNIESSVNHDHGGYLLHEIENNGIGPAVIESVNVFYRGQRIEDISFEGWVNLFRSFDSNIGVKRITIAIPEKDHAIAPGSTKNLVKIDFAPTYQPDEPALEDLRNIRIVINYKSVFGRKFKEFSTSFENVF